MATRQQRSAAVRLRARLRLHLGGHDPAVLRRHVPAGGVDVHVAHRWLVAIGVTAAVAGWAIRWWRLRTPARRPRHVVAHRAGRRVSPRGLVLDVFVNGTHPLLPWLAFFCAGMIVGRIMSTPRGCRGWRAAAVAVGLTLFTLGTWRARPHTSPRALVLLSTDPFDRGLVYGERARHGADRVRRHQWFAERFAPPRSSTSCAAPGRCRSRSTSPTPWCSTCWSTGSTWIRPRRLDTALLFSAIYWVLAIAAAVAYHRRFGRGPAEDRLPQTHRLTFSLVGAVPGPCQMLDPSNVPSRWSDRPESKPRGTTGALLPTSRGSTTRGRRYLGSSAGSGRRRRQLGRVERLVDLLSLSNWPASLASPAHAPAKQSACNSSAIEYSFARSGSACWACCTCSLMPRRFCTWWPYSWATMYCDGEVTRGTELVPGVDEELEIDVHEAVERAVERTDLRRRLAAAGVDRTGEPDGRRFWYSAERRRELRRPVRPDTSSSAPHTICSVSVSHVTSPVAPDWSAVSTPSLPPTCHRAASEGRSRRPGTMRPSIPPPALIGMPPRPPPPSPPPCHAGPGYRPSCAHGSSSSS